MVLKGLYKKNNFLTYLRKPVHNVGCFLVTKTFKYR